MSENSKTRLSEEKAEGVPRLLELKARFYDLMRQRELIDLEVRRVIQEVNRLEKGA